MHQPTCVSGVIGIVGFEQTCEEDMDAMTRERVGLLCDQLSRWPSLQTTIRDGGAEDELRDLLRQLASETAPDNQRVSELLDAIERACALQGLPGLTSRTSNNPVDMTTLPPGMTDVRSVVGWTCPIKRCNRVVTPDETSQPPTCVALHDANGRMTPYSPLDR
ncbi:hypothetical protein ACFWMT_19775 [Streptomyces sp. NPDC058368]|uniref:hypothetical protein n=1 Tax=Streptomyces sp. NPDC058368 TaxID=3346461 RepID=UPI003657E6E0